MKTASNEYIAKEEAATRKPIELYHVWSEYRTFPWTWKYTSPSPAPLYEEHFYYTSADVPITYDGNVYSPAAISRTSIQNQTQFEPSSVKVTSSLIDPVLDYIATNPVDILNIRILRIFSDQSPYEAGVIFIGEIFGFSFQGNAATLDCKGYETKIKRPIPKFRYQPQCNYSVYDVRCGADPTSYKETATITEVVSPLCVKVAPTGATWVQSVRLNLCKNAGFGYFSRGMMFKGYDRRMIVDEESSSSAATLYFRYPMVGLAVSDSVDLYPGCDGTLFVCNTVFQRLVKHLGFSFIPYDNPTLWIKR